MISKRHLEECEDAKNGDDGEGKAECGESGLQSLLLQSFHLISSFPGTTLHEKHWNFLLYYNCDEGAHIVPLAQICMGM